MTEAPAFLYGAVFFLGLILGSFLNVVIHRLPLMLQKDWRGQCRELLELPADTDDQGAFNLLLPPSSCPHCGHLIRWWENLPLVSYLFLLRGKCSSCKTPISWQYPMVEAITGILSVILVWQLGISYQTLGMLVLTYSFIALSVIDIRHQLLPDNMTQPLLWLGLLIAIPGLFIPLEQAVIGATVGYLSLWSFYWIFRLITKKDGMGFGDFKLLAVIGAWSGWETAVLTIFLSSLVGAIIGIAMIAFLKHDRRIPIPYGPYLAIAGWISILWGDTLIDSYSRAIGLG
jgi:leader peptidase (prepilin peptidase)/N-methyltransferase